MAGGSSGLSACPIAASVLGPPECYRRSCVLCPNNDGSLCSVAGPSSLKATTAPTVAASTRRAPPARPPPKSGLLEQAATKPLLRPSSSSRLKTNIAPTIPPRSRPRPTASPTAPSPHQTPASDSQAQHLRPVFTKQPDHQATVKATNPTPRASTHGLALTTATAHARQLVSRPHTGRPPGPTCLARASVADKSINVISGRTLCYHWIHAVLDGLYLTGGESPTCTPVYCHNTNGYTGGPSPPHLPPRSLRCACTSLFPETPVTSESCSNLAESANQANSEILQKFQANRASPPLASTGTAIGVIPTHDCAFPERARPLVTAGPGVSPFATTQLATDMSPAAQQGSTEALPNFERDPCVAVPLSTCTAPRKIPTPEICDFSKSALTGASRHRQRSGELLRSLGTTQGSRPGCLGRARAGSASAARAGRLSAIQHRKALGGG